MVVILFRWVINYPIHASFHCFCCSSCCCLCFSFHAYILRRQYTIVRLSFMYLDLYNVECTTKMSNYCNFRLLTLSILRIFMDLTALIVRLALTTAFFFCCTSNAWYTRDTYKSINQVHLQPYFKHDIIPWRTINSHFSSYTFFHDKFFDCSKVNVLWIDLLIIAILTNLPIFVVRREITHAYRKEVDKYNYGISYGSVI